MTTESNSLRYPRENQSERITFYITPSFRERVTAAILGSEMTQADWCRHALEEAVKRFERGASEDAPVSAVGAPGTSEQGEIARLTTALTVTQGGLATAQATIEGQERLIAQQRERQGMSDALNQEISKRLETALDGMNRLTLALPAAGESSASKGFKLAFLAAMTLI